MRSAILTLISGLLLALAWPPDNSFSVLLSFIGFAPILYVLVYEKISWIKFTILIYLSLLIFNILTTWWIMNSTISGAILAITANSLLMLVPFLVTRHVHHRLKNINVTLLFFIASWLTFEYFHFNWDGSWAWLTLGNVFSNSPLLIQWYEFTGVAGGTLWVLLANMCLVYLLNPKNNRKKKESYLSLFFIVILSPILISEMILYKNQAKLKSQFHQKTLHCKIVQPSIDPYKEKYNAAGKDSIYQKLFSLSNSKHDSTIDVIVWPETSIPYNIFESEVPYHPSYIKIRQYVDSYPDIHLLAGAMTFRKLQTSSQRQMPSARKYSDKLYYEVLNSVILFNKQKQYHTRHKSKLTPGVEIMPLSNILAYLNISTFDLGGITGSLGYDKQEKNFSINLDSGTITIAPLICYENNYGSYVANFVRDKAQILFLISNDGWWGNTAGYKQHAMLSNLRCIENRRWMVQCSNTGISCFISPLGKVVSQKGWYETTSFSQKVPALSSITFYTKHGDWIYHFFLIVWLIMTIYTFLILRLILLKNRKK